MVNNSLRWSRLLSICLLALLLAACGRPSAAAPSADAPSASAGSELFERLGCSGCHLMNGSGPAPSLAGLEGKTIQLQSGESVIADEQYVRTSILEPNAQIHQGYMSIMPSYKGRVNEDELTALVEYILSLEE